jgi:plastocyanin
MHHLLMAAQHPRSVGIVAAIGLAATLTVASAAAPAPRAETSSTVGIYEGTCDNLSSDPVFTLDEVAIDPAATRTGADSAAPVAVSTSTVDGTLDDLLTTPHAIAITQETTIACGDIGGAEVDDQIAFGLDEVGDSGFFGVVTLHGAGDGTEVMVQLAERASASGATPATGATPVADAPAEAVTIALFRFKPTELRITAGTTVVWTQTDAVPHTVTAVDGSFDSGSLVKGDTFEYTFETPGAFAYICDFHGSMKATIIVE